MKKCYKRLLSTIMIITILSILDTPLMSVAENTNHKQVKEQHLGIGIEHQEIKDDPYLDTGDPQRINIVKADLNNPNVQFKTTKALDRVLEVEQLSSQAEREMTKEDYNFVTGINGDMYTLATGMPRGMHLKNGILLNTYGIVDPDVSPTLAVDTDGQAVIDTVTAEGTAIVESDEDLTVHMLNRTVNNRVVLYTKDINQDSIVGLDREGGHLIFETEQFQAIIPGEKITGKIVKYVDEHVNGDQVTLEDNQYVLAGYGNKTEDFKELVKNEKTIEIQFDVFVDGDKNNHISEAISSYNWLVQDGEALTEQDMLDLEYEVSLVSTKNARTAIGLTADNEVIMMTIDKQTPTDSYSKGVTLETLAEAMKAEGAVTAVGLDGGGSTEMMVKPQGESDLKVQNELSDGSERGVTNGIFINYSAEQTDDIGEVIITPNDLTVFQDTSVPFSVKATDTNGNPLSLEDREIQWTAQEGSIDKNGIYKAPGKTIEDTIEATIDGQPGVVKVNVVTEIDSFSVGQEDARVLKNGDTVTFPVQAWAGGHNVIIDPENFSWELADSNLGDIENGALSLNDTIPYDTETDVFVSIGDLKETIHLYINKANDIIYDFNDYNLNETPFPGSKSFVETYDYVISDERAMSGSQSLMLDYHFGGWKTANGAMYANLYKGNEQPPEDLQADLLPKKLGMWMYSDGQEVPWVRAIVVDGDGESHTLNITPSNETWSGWRFISADISDTLPTPLHVQQLYLVETNHDYQEDESVGGQLFFDDIQWVYDGDPAFNVTELEALISEAEEITNNDEAYTDDSYEDLQDAIEAAQDTIDIINSEEALKSALTDLQESIDQLKAPEIDLTGLEDLIEEAEEITNHDDAYTDGSYESLQDAIEAANKSLKTINSNEALASAVTNLKRAIEELEESDEAPEINLTKLELLIIQAEGINNDDKTYTDGSYETLQEAIKSAKETLETIDSDETLDSAIDNLQHAIKGLDTENVKHDRPDSDSEQDGERIPTTATPMFNIMLVGLVLLILGATFFIIIHRRKNKNDPSSSE